VTGGPTFTEPAFASPRGANGCERIVFSPVYRALGFGYFLTGPSPKLSLSSLTSETRAASHPKNHGLDTLQTVLIADSSR
jgi:hypothetical protein